MSAIGPNWQKPDYEKLLRSLLNKVNRVTSAHRHGQPIRKKDLDDLSNRQIAVERKIL